MAEGTPLMDDVGYVTSVEKNIRRYCEEYVMGVAMTAPFCCISGDVGV